MHQDLNKGSQSSFYSHELGCYFSMLEMVNVISFALIQRSSGSLEKNSISHTLVPLGEDSALTSLHRYSGPN